MAERMKLIERLEALEARIQKAESEQSRTAEETRIRLDGIGSNELTDSELAVIMQIMNDGGNDYSGQLLTLKKMIIGLAEYCIRTRNS